MLTQQIQLSLFEDDLPVSNSITNIPQTNFILEDISTHDLKILLCCVVSEIRNRNISREIKL